MPPRPIIGYRQLSQVLHRSIGALKDAALNERLPLSVYRVGNTVIFDRDEVEAYAKNYVPWRRIRS
ncbi:hypothetical protein GCM10027288_11800 [Bordetella tumbae]